MKNMKRILATILAVIAVMAITAIPASAYTDNYGYGYGYNNSDRMITLQAVTDILKQDLGYADDHAAVHAAWLTIQVENGANVGESYYYSDVSQAYYYWSARYTGNTLPMPTNYNSNLNRRQSAAWVAYDSVVAKYPVDHPLSVAMLDVALAEMGTSCAYSYCYDNLYGTTDKFYYFNGSAVNGNRGNTGTNNNNYYDNGLSGTRISSGVSYWWDNAWWYQSTSGNQFFKIENRKQVWATSEADSIVRYGSRLDNNYAYSSEVDGYNGNNQSWYSNGNQQTNNSQFWSKQSYYSGLLTGCDQYINLQDAAVLADAMASYTEGCGDINYVATLGWVYVNICGGKPYAECVGTFPNYRQGAAASVRNVAGIDYTALAKDILFRKQAELNGVQNVGRLIPKTFTYFWIEGGSLYFRDANIGYDHSHDFDVTMWVKNGEFRSPYTTSYR